MKMQNTRDRRVMTFSPPHRVDHKEPERKKVAGTAVAKEYLILQPFSSAPQLTFEDVVPGTTATRLLEIRNTSSIDHVIIVDKIPVANGFSADPDVFIVPAGGSKDVAFLWAPTESTASCRCTVHVRSEQGYRGRIFLLGTVRKVFAKTTKAAKKAQPSGRVLAPSQKPNVKTEKKPAPAAKVTTKSRRLVTMPVEFKAARPKAAQPEMKRNVTFKLSKPAQPKPATEVQLPAPKCNFVARLPDAPVDSPSMRRETFTCNDTAEIPTNSTAVGDLEDSLDGSVLEAPIKNTTFTPPSAKKNVSEQHRHSSSKSPTELDFSGRMEELYRRLLGECKSEDESFATAPSDHERDTSEEKFTTPPNSRFLLSAAPKGLSECPDGLVDSNHLTFRASGTSGQSDGAVKPLAGTPSGSLLPDVLELIEQFEAGVNIGAIGDRNDDTSLMNMIDEYMFQESSTERCSASDFFPSDISSIHRTPTGKAIGGKHNRTQF
ncbi:uncharacterized protein LOC135369638 [Ornithodoros turicata]|uniref:uncharacterized protein LOC135369638 n=1 Tax=Ornithodoros turicata TaxID=34597 RepID=UPI0031394787